MKKYDVTIVGGGMVGLSLAALLCKNNFSVAVIEFGSFEYNPALTARVSAIHLASKKIFDYLQIWGDLKKTAAPLQEMKIWDHTHNAHLHFDSCEINETELGWIVPNHELVHTLHEKLKNENNVDFFSSCAPHDFVINHDLVELALNNGETIKTNLIVGADGAHSWVRQHIPTHTQVRPYYQKAIIAVIESSLPHQNRAYQKFLTTGPVALLPLQADNQTALVWSADDALSDELMNKTASDFDNALTESLDHQLGKSTSISERKQFPLVMRHTDEYVADHFALVGDAAHTIHPLAGLGVNLGLMDAACLAQVLIDARSSKKSFCTFHTLRRFTRWRKSENTETIQSMRFLKEVFAIDAPWFNIARTTGINTIDQSTYLKNKLMNMITGDRHDQPDFLTSQTRNDYV